MYELLSSRPKDQTHITCISCTGRQIIYWLCHLGINIHFKNHCHQLLLFMTKVGERTLEEVLISVLISTRKSRNCYTGYSSYYWDKSVPLMMMGITKNYYKFMGCDVYMINVFLLCYCFRYAYFSMKYCTSRDACYSCSSNRYWSADHCPLLKIISSLSTYVTCQSNPWERTLKTG